ncbi:MAG: rRNA methyltransferase [Patescibacteria group bacterium]
MPYRFAQDRPNYADFAAGPVLYSLPGRPAFPVRLTTEIFQRCQAHLRRMGKDGPYTVYDPCCGSGYLLTTLAYLHWPALRRLLASDVDPAAAALAGRNLSLLTLAGIEARLAQLADLHRQFGKLSHAQALAGAERLRARLRDHLRLHPLESRVFVADALQGAALQPYLADEAADIVMTDIPYGQRTTWREAGTLPGEPGPGWRLLEALRWIVTQETIIAVTADKGQKIAHEAYQRVEQFQIGKRRTCLFRAQV